MQRKKVLAAVLLVLAPSLADSTSVDKTGQVPDWMASTVSAVRTAVVDKVAAFNSKGSKAEASEPEHVFPKSEIQWDPARGQKGEPQPVSVAVSKKTQTTAQEGAAKTKAAVADWKAQVRVPYGDLAPFGREDTAKELTETSKGETDAMVDQLEKAEVAEEKRSVFRALTRLRGLAVTAYDGIARAQTNNIKQFAKNNKYRDTHPLNTLAAQEGDTSKWAFAKNADLLQTRKAALNRTVAKK
eukprot:TRINITY_DN110652_c0_g1_i1.p1 TRINITY_DN110652_c0_g1~~TRINITY_DN110652_c0_g1_i1.p1  ORF type:complete len:242 (-),score=67.24 TRINITY_DN110652_c0_g1_i1:122-847(-)